jgi:hypothetical protein
MRFFAGLFTSPIGASLSPCSRPTNDSFNGSLEAADHIGSNLTSIFHDAFPMVARSVHSATLHTVAATAVTAPAPRHGSDTQEPSAHVRLVRFLEAEHGRKLRRALVRSGHCRPDALAHYGNTLADTASMLCRDEDEVRMKMKELGLVGHPEKPAGR